MRATSSASVHLSVRSGRHGRREHGEIARALADGRADHLEGPDHLVTRVGDADQTLDEPEGQVDPGELVAGRAAPRPPVVGAAGVATIRSTAR